MPLLLSIACGKSIAELLLKVNFMCRQAVMGWANRTFRCLTSKGGSLSERRYILGGTDGWLRIRAEPSGQIVAVPELLRVDLTHTKEGRDHFTVIEGVHLGKRFSVKTGNLGRGAGVHKGPVQLVFDLTKNVLTYPGGTITTVSSSAKPTPVGIHPIQIPDFPHDGGVHYMNQSRYAKTWFFLGQGNSRVGNDRYLHTGQASLGCITADPLNWTKLYEYLIRCRSSDGKTIGRVSVVR